MLTEAVLLLNVAGGLGDIRQYVRQILDKTRLVSGVLFSQRSAGLLLLVTVIAAMTATLSAVQAQVPNVPKKKEASLSIKQKAWDLYSRMHTAWNSESLSERERIAAEVLDEKIEYQTVRHDTVFGRATVIEDMQTFHDRFPGGHFEIGDVSAHHNVALLTWVLIQADGTEFARGGDQITVGENGKIIKITTFGPSTRTPNG